MVPGVDDKGHAHPTIALVYRMEQLFIIGPMKQWFKHSLSFHVSEE